MIQFTKDAYRELNQHEQHFTRASKGGYTMGVNPKLAEEFLKWYKALGGNKHINLGCSNCVYTMLKELGDAYFKFVADCKENHPSWLNIEPEPEPANEPENLGEGGVAIAKAVIPASQSENKPEVEELPKEEKKASQKPKKATSAKGKKEVKKDGKDNG